MVATRIQAREWMAEVRSKSRSLEEKRSRN